MQGVQRKGAKVQRCKGAKVQRCKGAKVHRCTGTIGAQVHRCRGKAVCTRYGGAEVLLRD